MMVNLLWPRGEVYNPSAPFHWYLKWGALLFIAVVVGGGILYYRVRLRHTSGVLAEHASTPVDLTAGHAAAGRSTIVDPQRRRARSEPRTAPPSRSSTTSSPAAARPAASWLPGCPRTRT